MCALSARTWQSSRSNMEIISVVSCTAIRLCAAVSSRVMTPSRPPACQHVKQYVLCRHLYPSGGTRSILALQMQRDKQVSRKRGGPPMLPPQAWLKKPPCMFQKNAELTWTFPLFLLRPLSYTLHQKIGRKGPVKSSLSCLSKKPSAKACPLIHASNRVD